MEACHLGGNPLPGTASLQLMPAAHTWQQHPASWACHLATPHRVRRAWSEYRQAYPTSGAVLADSYQHCSCMKTGVAAE